MILFDEEDDPRTEEEEGRFLPLSVDTRTFVRGACVKAKEVLLLGMLLDSS